MKEKPQKHSSTDIWFGENLKDIPLETLQEIYRYNTQYPLSHDGNYNMGPHLLTELEKYIEIRKAGKFKEFVFNLGHRFIPKFGSLKFPLTDKDLDFS